MIRAGVSAKENRKGKGIEGNYDTICTSNIEYTNNCFRESILAASVLPSEAVYTIVDTWTLADRWLPKGRTAI